MNGVDNREVHEKGSGMSEEMPSRLPFFPMLIGLVSVLVISVSVLLTFGQVQRFAGIARAADPLWIAVAAILQLLTYMSAGQVWSLATRSVGKRLPMATLVRLSVEKLAVDQLLPSAGIAGHVSIAQALRLFGFPSPTAMEAVLLDVISFQAAYAVAAAGAFAVLAFRHEVTPIILYILGVFAVISIVVPASAVVALRNRERLGRLPGFISRRRIVGRLLGVIARMSPDRVLETRAVMIAACFQSLIFVLDGASLFATLRAVGVSIPFGAAFAAFVIGSVAGTVSFIPGGIGTFEVAATTTLIGLGVSFEEAFAGTLLLRGMTLWIPIVPGAIYAHRDLGLGFFRNGGA